MELAPTQSFNPIADPHQLSMHEMERILSDTAKKICENKCHHESTRNELLGEPFVAKRPHIASLLLKEMATLTNILPKKRNIQKFYSSYFAKVVLANQKFAPGMTSNTSTLLLSKVADLIVVYFKSFDDVTPKETPVYLRENEIYGLQYIGGYVLHRLHDRLKSKKGNEEMILAISSCKGSDDAFEDARLINAVNREGLWCPSKQ